MRFSIVMPAYNVEKYIENSIESVLNQSYKNFELIIINDGSTDGTQKIIESYKLKDKRIKVFNKKNTGPSDTRNYGVEKSTGDYLCFLDSDDTMNRNFLKNAVDYFEKDNLDMLKITYAVTDGMNTSETLLNPVFNNVSGFEAFYSLVDNGLLIDIAWVFIYKKEYWDKHNYKFPVGLFHEDFGLIPEILINAKKVSSMNDSIIYYLCRPGSTMTNKKYDFILKKAYDTLIHYDHLKKVIYSLNTTKKYRNAFIYYIENSTINKLKELKQDDYKKYIVELKKRNIFKLTCTYNLKYIIKKIILILNTKLYLKMVIK